MNTPQAIKLFGVLFLGLFVGVLLALAVRGDGKKSPTQKTIRFAIAAALSGAPVAFMTGLTFEKWMYPIGLLFGLSVIRMASARDALVAAERDGQRRNLAQLFAWIDLLGIAFVFLVVTACIVLFT